MKAIGLWISDEYTNPRTFFKPTIVIPANAAKLFTLEIRTKTDLIYSTIRSKGKFIVLGKQLTKYTKCS